MYARVASFNLGDGADQMVDQVRGDVESGNRPRASKMPRA